LGNVVVFCNQGEVSCALAESSKLNLAAISNEDIFLTLSHHVCIALSAEGNVDSAVEYLTTTVLKMSLRRESKSLSRLASFNKLTKPTALEQTCSSMIFLLLKNDDLPGALKIYQTLSRFNLWPTIRKYHV
jgi:hypothetical protein